MPREKGRRTPDELLREVQAAEAGATRAQLKIFLGYASGVGKSFRMLDEARRRRERGQDVVVGGIQPSVPPGVVKVLSQLEVIPVKVIEGRPAIDLNAIIRRHPAVCVIDGLAYENPPGSRNAARWQDVEALLDAGIKVIGSINIQYIAELREQVEAVTGKPVSETVPVAFIERADEIEIVDAPETGALQHAAEESVYAAERSRRLAKLRELALVLAANVIDRQLNRYLERHGIRPNLGTQERILVCITPRANIRDMIATGRTIADRFHGELFVAHVNQPQISEADRRALEEKLAVARAANARIEILEGEDPVEAIIGFAKSRGITELFIGHSQRSGIRARLWGNPVDQLIRRSEGMDVRIFPQ